MGLGMCSVNMELSKGQSISEFIVTMAVLVPLLLALASFANLLTLSTETAEAGRLAAWERTVYGDDLNDAALQAKIADNIREVYLDERFTDFGPGKQLDTNNLPSIVDRTVNGGQPVSVNLPGTIVAGTGMVNEGTRLVNQIRGGTQGTTNMVMQSPEISIAVNENYSLLKMVSFDHYRKAVATDPGVTPYDQVAGRAQFNIASQSALIANGWMPSSEEDLQDITSEAAFDEQGLSVYQDPTNRAFDFLGFDEASLSVDDGDYSTAAVNAGSILPSDL